MGKKAPNKPKLYKTQKFKKEKVVIVLNLVQRLGWEDESGLGGSLHKCLLPTSPSTF